MAIVRIFLLLCGIAEVSAGLADVHATRLMMMTLGNTGRWCIDDHGLDDDIEYGQDHDADGPDNDDDDDAFVLFLCCIVEVSALA